MAKEPEPHTCNQSSGTGGSDIVGNYWVTYTEVWCSVCGGNKSRHVTSRVQMDGEWNNHGRDKGH